MTRPLAIVFYERLLPGSQVVNRLADMGYRVQAMHVAAEVPHVVESCAPMVLVADLVLRSGDFSPIIARLKAADSTKHVPILGYCDPKNAKVVEAAIASGAKLVAGEAGILEQLPQLMEHVLALD
ncbi:MAG TPA: hypothetical protein VMF06_10075 [Candidatus Limnocylindria bacterium]|nr:hypothetical protein [Candidatus Limnocylindria bacterium]